MKKGYVDQIEEGEAVIVFADGSKKLLSVDPHLSLAVNDQVVIMGEEIIEIQKADQKLYLKIKEMEKQIIKPFSNYQNKKTK